MGHRPYPLALIVDDDISMRLSMAAALTKAKFEIVEAENGRMAISLFQSKKPDIILLDVMMPGIDGFETCAAIRQLPGGKYVQIIMVTGKDDSESTERAFEVGANDFVAKPINWVMLGHRGRYMLRAGRAFQELTRSKQRLTKTQQIAKLGNWEIALAGNTFHCSLEAARLLGLSLDKGPITYDEFLSPVVSDEKERVRKEMENSLHLNKSFRINYRVILPDGSLRYILNHGEILYDEKGNPEIMLGAIQDVSELREAEEEIHRLAFHDGLTGLANRMLFLDRLGMEVTSATRKNEVFALLFLDLDQFKRVNDSYGHHIGDLLLKNVAENMKQCIRSTDTNAIFTHKHPETIIARIGGDEFTILLSDIKSPENAALVSRRIIDAVSTTYNLEGHEIVMTTSIGIAIFPVDGNRSEILLKNADSAMYQAKVAGRNNYQFYDKRLNTEALERAAMERDIRLALERDEFVLYYQPQIEFSTGKIVGAEALIRWVHPVKGMVAPVRFIPVAERSGLISSINEWVIKTVCKQSSRCSAQGFKKLRLAVNLSGHHFLTENFIQVVKENILAKNVDPKNIKLEITENTIMHNAKDSIAILEQIRDHHVSVVLDDFGTGYSSLSYLTSFPVDTVKIDRSFVMGCTSQTKNMLTIKAIIAMGHSLGMKVIAEGVETREQFDILRELGCDEGQGYYFSPPVPRDEFEKILTRGQL